jgi:hypothetical protein
VPIKSSQPLDGEGRMKLLIGTDRLPDLLYLKCARSGLRGGKVVCLQHRMPKVWGTQ